MNYKLALLAKDIHNSVLPKTYQFFGDCLGIEVDFEIYNILPEEVERKVAEMKRSLDGFTVTMPYKVKILDYCDELDISAEKCGSANTVLVKDGRLIGYNTDGWGMIKCLQLKGFDFKGKKVTLVGAGGVARSIAYHLLVSGVKEVDVLNLFENETEALVRKMGPLFSGHLLNQENLVRYTKGRDVFINASILGQVGYDDYEDLDFLDGLQPDALVFDVNYSNPDAKLPRTAKEKGFRSYVGKAMSSCQGIWAMEIWTGKKPSDDDARKLVADVEGETGFWINSIGIFG